MPTLQELSQQLIQSGTAPTAKNYDAQYETTKNQIAQSYASLGSNQEQALRRQGEDYDVASRNLAQNEQKQEVGLQNRLANQGILRSGINVGAQANMAKQYQQNVGALTQANTRGKEDIARDTAGKQQDLTNQMQQAEVDRSGRQTTRELKEAEDTANALAAKTAADQQRQWMDDIQNKLLAIAQPTPSPTGQMQQPPPVQQAVQQALKQAPPPGIPVAPPDMIRNVQDELKHQGFDLGAADGIVGPRTLAAYNKWRANLSLPPVGRITMEDVQLIADNKAQEGQLMGSAMGGVVGGRSGQQA